MSLYSGDANNLAGTSSAIGEVIVKAPSETTLTSTPNPSADGAPVMFTASILPAAATGTVTFYHGSTSLGTATVTKGKAKFTTSTLSPGPHSITVAYAGDANDEGSTSSAVTQVVQ